MSMRGGVVVALLLAGLSGCWSGAGPAPRPMPSALTEVAQIEPCQMLPAWAVAELGLEPGRVDQADQVGYRRTCHFQATRATGAIVALDLVLRASPAGNVVADADRLVETARWQEEAAVETVLVGRRPVYRTFRLQPPPSTPWRSDRPVCSLLFGIDRTASFEALLTLPGDARQCPAAGVLLDVLAATLPPPVPGPGPSPSGRSGSVTALDPCALIPAAQRARLGLGEGRPSVDGCLFFGPAGEDDDDGALSWMSTTVFSDHAPRNAQAVNRTVTGRPAYETRFVLDALSGNRFSVCAFALEVGRTAGVTLDAAVEGAEPGPACRFVTEVAPSVEALLPPVTA